MNRLTVGLLATFTVLLLGCGLLAYVLRDRAAQVDANAPRAGTPGATATPPPADNQERPLLWQLFGSDSQYVLAAQTLVCDRAIRVRLTTKTQSH
ncbi:MAG: hypothetical protein ACXW18_12760 [Pyrinomonadaceae bacterium]